MKRQFILVDIDHTLSDAAHRDALIGGEGGWDAYHMASQHDQPVHDIAYMVNALHNFGYIIVGITARPQKWRSITMEWLATNKIAMDKLLMRDNVDFRPADQVKFELAINCFPDLRTDVAFIIDDREDVCAAFKAFGITTLQCNARYS